MEAAVLLQEILLFWYDIEQKIVPSEYGKRQKDFFVFYPRRTYD